MVKRIIYDIRMANVLNYNDNVISSINIRTHSNQLANCVIT